MLRSPRRLRRAPGRTAAAGPIRCCRALSAGTTSIATGIGISTGRRVGTAVVRNRVRRRLRHDPAAPRPSRPDAAGTSSWSCRPASAAASFDGARGRARRSCLGLRAPGRRNDRSSVKRDRHRADPPLPDPVRVAAVALPLRAQLLALHRAGDRPLRPVPGQLDGRQAHRALRSVASRRLRPRPLSRLRAALAIAASAGADRPAGRDRRRGHRAELVRRRPSSRRPRRQSRRRRPARPPSPARHRRSATAAPSGRRHRRAGRQSAPAAPAPRPAPPRRPRRASVQPGPLTAPGANSGGRPLRPPPAHAGRRAPHAGARHTDAHAAPQPVPRAAQRRGPDQPCWPGPSRRSSRRCSWASRSSTTCSATSASRSSC